MGYLPVSFFLLQIMPAAVAMERSVSCSWNKEQMLMPRKGQAKYHWYTEQHTLVICQWWTCSSNMVLIQDFVIVMDKSLCTRLQWNCCGLKWLLVKVIWDSCISLVFSFVSENYCDSQTKEKYKTMNLDLNKLKVSFNVSMQSRHVCFSHWWGNNYYIT